MYKDEYLLPQWAAPKNIRALVTTRNNGYSSENYASFNLATHVGDNPQRVAQNREKLIYDWHLKSPPQWLQQVHSNQVILLKNNNSSEITLPPMADAAITQQTEVVCTILTADCLSIFLTNQEGSEVAAIHAGWRGLLNGVIDNTITAMQSSPKQLIAWLGPAIGPEVFELSAEIRVAFTEQDEQNMYSFVLTDRERWFANIYQLARNNLQRCGISNIYGGNFCTYTDQDRFYSYRRDQGTTGRMASLIWIT